jgi:predicted PurR-regulated permease PerM
MERKHIEMVVFVGLLAAVLYLAFVMLKPFANTLFLAAVLAFLFTPTHRRLSRWLGNSPSWSALLITLLVLITVLIPLAFAGYQIVREAADIYSYLRAQTDPADLIRMTEAAQSWIERVVPNAKLDPEQISTVLQQGIQWLLASAGNIFAGFGRVVFHFVFLLLFFYYLVRDGHHIVRALQRMAPLPGTQGARLTKTMGNVVSGTVRGNVLVAIIQGLVAGLGFWLFGVPNPALWGGTVVAASFIPSIGTALVQIPAIVFLVVSGNISAAIGLGLWATFLVSTLDNILKPKLIGSATKMHPLIAMVGVLGGITVFGPMGILIGPVVMAFLIALVGVYHTARP